ncbi:MAG TPA: cobyrinate a,c-diamide synthase, partial [Rhodospirillales bacterium]
MTGRAGAGSGACKGLTVAAPASGSGKTTLTLGLLRRLAGQGVAVASAKAGPDYIDPAFHAAASGRPCLNLDAWAMRPETLGLAAARLATDATVIVCEGVMGLFDGAIVGDAQNRHKNDDGNDGSTAALSRITGWPVVLVVDAAAQGASAAAVVKGFAEFRPGVRVAGVVFNRVGGDRHAAILKESCRAALPEVPVLGCLPRAAGVELPERHLGLVQAGEHPDLESFLESAARLVAEHVDVDALLSLARPFASSINDPASPSVASSVAPPIPPLGQRIAVARDRAFAFAYPLVIDGWRAAGAEVTTFSPLADEAPEATADAVYLPGGYPELHGGKL